MRAGPDREVARLRGRRSPGGRSRERFQPPGRGAPWLGGGKSRGQGERGNGAILDRLLDRRGPAVRSPHGDPGVHGSGPARLRRCVGRRRTAGLGFRDRAGAPSRAEQRDRHRPQGRGDRRMTTSTRSGSLGEPGRPPREGAGLQAFRHLYIHLPFCRHKCGYCDFNAYAGMDRLIPEYVDALEQELVFARERYPFQQLETVYFGGGTPSLLPAAEVSRLLEFIRRNFNLAPDAEVTLEANPASTDETKIAAWLEGGVNRLSLGVQGFDPRALAVLERKTDAAQAVRAFSLAREMGMSDVS